MFRAVLCSSSGGQIVLLQPLVSSLSVNSHTVIYPPEDEQGTARNMSRIMM